MAAESSTQYVAYTLYQVDPAWKRLPIEERAAGKEAFAEVVAAWQDRMELRSYSLVGVRPVRVGAAEWPSHRLTP